MAFAIAISSRCAGIVARRIDQGGSDAECAVLHRLAHERLHGLDFGGGGSALFHAFDVHADRGGSDEGADIRRDAVFLHGLQPGVEAVRSLEADCAGLRGLGGSPVVGRGGSGAFAEDFGSDPLRDLADRPAVAVEELVAGLALDIDEARRDDQALSVDSQARRGAGQQRRGCDTGNAVAADREIAGEPGVAGAVHDPAAEQDYIEGGVLCERRACQEGQDREAHGNASLSYGRSSH